MITLVKAAFVVAYEQGDHVIIRDGEVAYEGDSIIFVGKSFAGTPDAVIDAGDAILGPGFIDLDALADIDHALIDSWHGPDTATGLDWSEDYFLHRRRDFFSAEDRDFGTSSPFTQLIRNGITTRHADRRRDAQRMVRDLRRMGRRGGYCRSSRPAPLRRSELPRRRQRGARRWYARRRSGTKPSANRGFNDAVRFVTDFDGAYGGLIRGAVAARAHRDHDPELMRRTADAARSLGVKVRLHCLQGAKGAAATARAARQNAAAIAR